VRFHVGLGVRKSCCVLARHRTADDRQLHLEYPLSFGSRSRVIWRCVDVKESKCFLDLSGALGLNLQGAFTAPDSDIFFLT